MRLSSDSPDPDRSRSDDRGTIMLLFLQRRVIFLVCVLAVLGLGLYIWHYVTRIAEVEEEQPAVAIEPVVDGRFLGIPIRDQTRDEIIRNSWLRLAMNEGYRAATVYRRHQIESIWLQEGQHPETGQRAVIVSLTPRPREVPRPPFEAVAVRRWQPQPDRVYDSEALAERQRRMRPVEEDLARLRDVWSGDRYADVQSLHRMTRRIVIIAVVGLGLMLLAGAYRMAG